MTFETADGCAPAGDIMNRAAQYHVNELELSSADGSAATIWRIQPNGVRHAVMVVDERIRRRPEKISFCVKNLSKCGVQFAVEVHELGWIPKRENCALPWRLGKNQTVDAGMEKTLSFSFADAQWPERKIPEKPRFPIGAIIIIVEGLEDNAPHMLRLGRLTIHYPPPADPRVAELSCPPVITASRTAIFGVRLDGNPAAAETLDLEIRRGNWIVWRTRLNPTERERLHWGKADVERAIPWFLSAGEATVGLAADGYRVAGPEAKTVIENDISPELPTAERKAHNGRPTFFLNGKPTGWQGYSSYDYQPGSVDEFGRNGANVFCVPCCAGKHVHHCASASNWIAPDRFDFGQIDERVSFSLDANPDGIIFLRVSLALPPFWTQTNKDELVCAYTEKGVMIWEEGGATRVGSLASEVWRRDQERAARELIRHCRKQPWACRLAGIWITGEVTEEWFAWGCNDGVYCDYSKPNRQQFERVISGMGIPRPADSVIPSPEERKAPGLDIYPDTPSGRAAALYNGYYSELTSETICHFAQVVKEETDGRCLVGCFCGYVIQLAGESRQATSGNFALRRLIDDPNVDFLAGIPLHDFRNLTQGYNPHVSATESMQAAGKFYCNENDLFSWLHNFIWHTLYDEKDPRRGAILMHRRECASDAVRGTMAQKFSLATSWHRDDRLQEDFARQARILSNSINLDRTPVEEIAFVVDDTSFAWTPPETMLLNATHKRLLYHAGRTGAPVGVWLFSDLDKLPDRVKFVVVAHAPAARRTDVAKLQSLLEKGGRCVLAVGPVGLVDPEKARREPSAPSEALGLPIRIADDPLPGVMKLRSDGSIITSIQPVRPGAYADCDGQIIYENGLTAMATRELADGGRLVWCGLPPLSTSLLRNWIEAAGVHCYAPAEYFVHASRAIVSITAPSEGPAALRWPRKVEVCDLFDGWTGRGAEMTCNFEAGQTRLFEIR